jgi:propionate CoA-transferase
MLETMTELQGRSAIVTGSTSGKADAQTIRAALDAKVAAIGQQVPAMVDYTNFVVLPDALDAYSDMVRDFAGRHYSRVTRYTTSAFLRAKLGEALLERGVAPHIFESAEDATGS